ncbi:MAG: hypothetical protein HFE78_07375 [Clostridiales bacterium]|nr:hypothetical protein [Clostridiales bacterium]
MSKYVDEIKRGYWISTGTGYNWCYDCSECGWKDCYPFNDRFNYCPNCGAKMDGEKNDIPRRENND